MFSDKNVLDAYTSKDLVYQWQNEGSVNFVPGMTLSQFDLISSPYRNFTLTRREGEYWSAIIRFPGLRNFINS